MLEPNTIHNGLAAFVTGILISPHCVAMCGPLACTLIPSRALPGEADLNRTLYHTGRVVSYTLIGATAGALGLAVTGAFALQPVVYFPWLLIAVLLAFALRLDRLLPQPRFLKVALHRLIGATRRLPTRAAALGVGLATPSLPCAPLYAMFWVALLSGSPLFGAEIALGFAIGTVPLLWIGQTAFGRIRAKFRPEWVGYLQRGVALLAALFLLWRILAGAGVPMGIDSCPLHG